LTATFKVKVLLTGSAASEKSELINKFIKSKFTSNYKLTMGVDILTKEVEYNPGEVAKVTIWDIGGDENFESRNKHKMICSMFSETDHY